MNRRNFLKLAGLTGAGVVATATMSEAGFLADFLSWIKRRPAWSIPKDAGKCLTAADIRDAANTLAHNTYTQGKDAYFGIVHPFVIRDIAADDLLPELSLSPLDINYEFKAFPALLSTARKKEIDAEFFANGIIPNEKFPTPRDWKTAKNYEFRNRMALFTAS